MIAATTMKSPIAIQVFRLSVIWLVLSLEESFIDEDAGEPDFFPHSAGDSLLDVWVAAE